MGNRERKVTQYRHSACFANAAVIFLDKFGRFGAVGQIYVFKYAGRLSPDSVNLVETMQNSLTR